MVERTLMFGNKTMVPFSLGLIAVLGVLIVYLYRTERRMIRRWVGVVLTVLRVILLVILLLMLTDPIISITTTEGRLGTLIVMVDNSRSMQIPDGDRPGYEKLRLADALGLLGEGVHRSGLASAEEGLAVVLDDAGTAGRQWGDFAEVMALGVLEENERTQRLNASLGGTQKLRSTLARVVSDLEVFRRTATPLSVDIARRLAGIQGKLSEVNTDIVDEIIRQLGSGEFRARLTVGRLREINQSFTRTTAQLARTLTELRELVVSHDTEIAATRLKLVPDVVAGLDRTPRLELVGMMLADRHVDFVGRLKDNYKLQCCQFSRTVTELPVQVTDNGVTVTVGPPASTAEGLYTDLAGGLLKAVASVTTGEVSGVVVLTDGRSNHGEDPLKEARVLGARCIPLYPVVVGSEVSPRDIAVVKVAAADVVHEKDAVEASVLVKAAGFEDQELTLSLREKGKPVVEKTFTLPKGSDRMVVKLRFVPEGKGTHDYVATVPVQAREVFTGNNEKPFAISVLDKKLRILMVDGGPRWEYRYLKNALLRDKRVDLKYLLFNPLTTSQEEIKRSLEAFPHEQKDMFAFDTLILGDVDPKQLSSSDLANVEAFVNDRGGTLIVIAGRDFMPAAYAETVLAAVLPVVSADDPGQVVKTYPRDGFILKLTREARESAVFRLSPDEKENVDTWAELPRMMWYAPVKKVRPGAQVWVYGVTGETQADDAEWVNPIILTQSYGLGRVFYTGADATWRWRYKVADKYFHQFWGQVILWATSGKLPTGTERVKLGTDKFEYLDGEDVVVRARVLSEKMLPVGDAMVSARLVKKTDGAVVAKTQLDYLPRSGGHYEGKFLAVPTGSYAVTLAIPAMEEELKAVSSAVEVKEAPTRELIELSADVPFLRELADRSGGRCFALDELARLPNVLKPLKWNRINISEIRFRTHWFLLFVFCAVVTVEWVLRKKEGLL